MESMEAGGFCIVSYRPSQISPVLLQALNHLLLTRLRLTEEIKVLEPHMSQCDNCPAVLEQLPRLARGQAYLVRDQTTQPNHRILKFQVGPRSIPHIRHLNKYLRAPLPKAKRFYFHTPDGRYLERAAANLWEFREALAELPISSITHHLERNDFDRWLIEVLHDAELAQRIRKIAGRGLDGETLRQALLEVVVGRYEELDALA